LKYKFLSISFIIGKIIYSKTKYETFFEVCKALKEVHMCANLISSTK